MKKKQAKLSYTFDNPNTASEFEQLLKRIILQKLLACHKEKLLANHI